MKRNEYKVWLTNMWDEDLLQEVVAIFYDLEKAIEFVEYQLKLGRSCIIKQDGKRIDIDQLKGDVKNEKQRNKSQYKNIIRNKKVL